MAKSFINRDLYDALINFETSDEAKEFYYKTMDEATDKEKKDGTMETLNE